MANYDPETAPRANEWLDSSEGERTAAVEVYHRRKRIRLPNPTIHAAIHTVVENQLAMGLQVVIDALARLRSEGLTRHDAIHAIGSVLAEEMFAALTGPVDDNSDLNVAYLDRISRLTAEQWRRSGDARRP